MAKREHDTRPVVSPAQAAAALAAAAEAALEVLAPTTAGSDARYLHRPTPRFRHPERWGELRRLMHSMGAEDRASACLELTLEVSAREAHDRELGQVPVVHVTGERVGGKPVDG